MLKVFKYRLYPNKQQSELINKHIGACRFVYNLALETKKSAYLGNKVNLSCFDLNKQLPELKKECEWLKEVNSQSLQQSITHLDSAFKRFFKNQADFPKFKSKHNNKQSFQCPQTVNVDFDNNTIVLPKFKTPIKIVLHRKFKGVIKTVTISKTPTNKYFASILIENNIEISIKAPIIEETSVGIDVGIKSFLVASNGQEFDNPKYLKQSLSHLKYLQKQVSKKVKGSYNRKKAVLKLAKQHEKVANQRKDFLNKTSTAIIKQYDNICIEDLKVSNMLKNHCLAQSISDCGWGMFFDMLEYKAEWYSKNILKIGTFEPSSKTCNVCGSINKELTLQDREWTCKGCGTLLNRDKNAAINIKKFALNKKLCMERTLKNLAELPTLVGVLKQEAIDF